MNDVRDALLVGRNTEGKLVNRPLSPFMIGTAYRPQMSSMTSIFHRITGVALGGGTILFTLWLVCAAAGDGPFSIVQAVYTSGFGMIVLFLFTLALFYHFCNGIRHLAWDMGKGFELRTMHRSGALVIVATLVLSIGFWALAFLIR
jgi:succinate dehydrogenase / fumarate reductase cytochrome b subunit